MAYSSTVTVTEQGAGHVVVTITETEVAASSEATIPLGFDRGIVLKQRCKLTAGSGTTIDPVLGLSTDPAAGAYDLLVANGTAAAQIHNEVASAGAPRGAVFYTSTGTLYHRSVPDSAADNAVITEYLIQRGWR